MCRPVGQYLVIEFFLNLIYSSLHVACYASKSNCDKMHILRCTASEPPEVEPDAQISIWQPI